MQMIHLMLQNPSWPSFCLQIKNNSSDQKGQYTKARVNDIDPEVEIISDMIVSQNMQ